MNYDLSAVEILCGLGYDRSVPPEWLEWLGKRYPLPRVYREFMTLAADCPLLGTADVWTGQMAHGRCVPGTLYDLLQEEIADRSRRWSSPPTQYENMLLALSQLPQEQWPLENYLLIGSDYASAIADFGIRVQDLQKEDPPVYWHRDGDDFSVWQLEAETLSDFLRKVLFQALSCVLYNSAETALEEKGWRYEEYFDPEADDWTASKAVLQQQGISLAKLKTYPVDGGTVFCCCDTDRNIFFVGNWEDEEMSLFAVNREDAERVFCDPESMLDG